MSVGGSADIEGLSEYDLIGIGLATSYTPTKHECTAAGMRNGNRLYASLSVNSGADVRVFSVNATLTGDRMTLDGSSMVEIKANGTFSISSGRPVYMVYGIA